MNSSVCSLICRKCANQKNVTNRALFINNKEKKQTEHGQSKSRTAQHTKANKLAKKAQTGCH